MPQAPSVTDKPCPYCSKPYRGSVYARHVVVCMQKPDIRAAVISLLKEMESDGVTSSSEYKVRRRRELPAPESIMGQLGMRWPEAITSLGIKYITMHNGASRVDEDGDDVEPVVYQAVDTRRAKMREHEVIHYNTRGWVAREVPIDRKRDAWTQRATDLRTGQQFERVAFELGPFGYGGR
jgi:hypothetical protein